jgi:transposase-like protein
MFTQIRRLLDEPTGKLQGRVEVDDTYMGGKRRTGKRGRPSLDPNHPPVFGMVERRGKVHARVTKDVRAETIHPIVKAFALPKTMIFSDEMNAYVGLNKHGYAHKRIKHEQRMYVMGDVHTNTIECF